MNQTDDVIEMLRTSQEALKRDVIPALSSSERTSALMIANALGIAVRMLERGDALLIREWEGLARFVEENGDLQMMRKAMMQRIRQGMYDSDVQPAQSAAVRRLLEALALSQCEIDRPQAIFSRRNR